jgi:hypothetical protein
MPLSNKEFEMASKQFITRVKFGLNASILAAVLVPLLFNPVPAFADGESQPQPVFPDFGEFSQSVADGKEDTLRGVYVPGVLALPVIQQPYGNPGFVSPIDNVATQFGMAAEVGNVGLLAHNHLAGSFFFSLERGQEVRLVYGDGRVEYYIITQVLRYQALNPYSPYSEFRDLETDVTITANELFRQVYRGDRHVTFQTCIESDGNLSWGRLFVIAVPLVIDQEKYLSHLGNIIQ